ncbi:MAG: transglutaminase domain-containing protein [Clostridia bacterium]|nr:transglutaminase domain-containing protein [Clostridia bacterium]
MNKKTNAFIITALAIICVLAIAGTAVSAFAYMDTRRIMTAMQEQAQEPDEDETREDDVCIGEEYFIRSTTAISDAYKSGDASALDDRQKETLSMASAILGEVIEDGMTPFEKEKAVYEWLTLKLINDNGILTVIPTTGEDRDNPYGVLKYRSAVCVGYATTFRLFMQMMDIDCKVVHDLSLCHSWDLVKLDGDWYHVDCYFDSDIGSYRHFNMNDTLASYDHDWDRSFFPHASGNKYNMALINVSNVGNIYDIPQFVKDCLDEGKTCFSCTFDEGIAREDESTAAAITSAVYNIVSMMGDGKEVQYEWIRNDAVEYVLCWYTYSYNSGTVDLPDETIEKINEALSEAFGDDYVEYDPDYGYNGAVG